MADEWRECLLGDVIELKRGYDLPERDRRPGAVPIISSSGPSGFHDQVKVTGPGAVTGRYGTIGQVFYLPGDFWPLNTTLYVRDFKGNDPRFVSYFLRGLDYLAYSDKAAVPGVNRNHLHQAEVRLPEDVAEQRAIAHILGTLDDKIELNRRMSETLEAMARALFKSWFVDFEPVQVGSLVTAPEHLATGDAPGREESEAPSCASDLPAGWSFVPFGELLDVVKETIEPSDSPTESFVHFSIPSFDEGRTPKREAGAEIKSLKFRVPSGSVLMSKLNPEIDRVWLVDVPDETRSVCSTEFMVLRPRHPVDRTFVYFTARSSEFRTRLQGLVTGTSKSHQRAQIPSVLAIPVVSPPASVAAEWARRAEPLMRRVALGREESALLAALRDTLLPKLISGELRVPDAERFVEKALADGGSKS